MAIPGLDKESFLVAHAGLEGFVRNCDLDRRDSHLPRNEVRFGYGRLWVNLDIVRAKIGGPEVIERARQERVGSGEGKGNGGGK